MELDDILERFFQVVSFGLTHKHYDHVVKKRYLYKQLVAGVNLDELLNRYVRRESPELFEQRVRLTNHIVTSVCKNLLDVFYKVPKSNSIRRTIAYQGENSNNEKISDIENMMDNFWGVGSFDDYMATRYVEMNSDDPNSFVVLEWDPFNADIELIQPKPFEVTSIAAVDFKFNNRVLQYLVVKDTHLYKEFKPTNSIEVQRINKPGHGMKEGFKYTLYTKNQTFKLIQVDEGFVIKSNQGTDVNGARIFGTLNEEPVVFIKLGEHYYQFIEFAPHNCGNVLAFRVGYYRDLSTDGETYVNPLHGIEPYLLKTIKVNSELDLVATILALPQQLQYTNNCPDQNCYEGVYSSGATCSTCNGTGLKSTAPSAQDSIALKMPASKEEWIPLDQIIHYSRPPVDIVKWQEDYIENLTLKLKKLMFNSDVFDRKHIADTATGKSIDMQNVYDVLHPFFLSIKNDWIFSVMNMAKLADRDKGLVVNYTSGRDFKFKSLDSLIFDLSIANNLGNMTIIEHFNDDIAHIIYGEEPIELMRYKTKKLHNPFQGKSEKEVFILLASPFVSKSKKILYANFSNVFDELEIELAKQKINFYELNRIKQQELINSKVEELEKKLSEENPEPEVELN